MIEHRRIRDIAFILPFVGLFLFLPPIISLFDTDVQIFGVPLIQFYVFFCWAALVLGGALVSHRLGREEMDHELEQSPSDQIEADSKNHTGS